MKELKILHERTPLTEPWRAITKRLVRFSRSISIENLLRSSLMVLVVGNLVIVGGISIKLSRDAQWKKVRELQEEQALSIGQQISTRLNEFERQLSYLQKLRDLSAFPQEIQRTLLEGITRQNNAYETIAIVNRQGEILSAIAPYTRENAAKIVLAASQKPDIIAAIRQQTRYITPVEWHRELNVPMAIFVLPLQDRDGRPQGVLVATINLDFLNAVVARSRIGETGYVYILDPQNRIIAKKRTESETYREAQLEPLRDRALIKTLSTAPSEVTEIYQGLRGVRVLGTSSVVYSVNWRVIVELPLEEMYAPIRRSMEAMLIILAIAIITSILLSLKMARSLISPMESLTQAANQISGEKFGTQVKLDYHNEWGILASAFNKMTARIHHSFQILEVKNEELLDTLEVLKKTQTQLIQKEKMSGLGQLVAGVAHEINNPINFIHGNLVHTEKYAHNLLDSIALYRKYYPHPTNEIEEQLEAIEIEFIQEDFPKVIQSMKMGSERVRAIVTSLRSFSRLDEASFKEVDLHEGIENTLVILQNQMKAQSGRCEIELVKNYGKLPLVSCYPAQLNQVFMNLLNNALDALEKFRLQDSGRKPTIQIATEYIQLNLNLKEPSPGISIRITDNGEGISEEVIQHIFNPFFTTKPIGKGTGLGLSISYQIIVEAHQGTLDCSSILGEGTTFQIDIPARLLGTTLTNRET